MCQFLGPETVKMFSRVLVRGQKLTLSARDTLWGFVGIGGCVKKFGLKTNQGGGKLSGFWTMDKSRSKFSKPNK